MDFPADVVSGSLWQNVGFGPQIVARYPSLWQSANPGNIAEAVAL